MAVRKISTKLAIEGEAQYRQALQSINSSLSTLNSQLKLTKSEFQNQQNSLTALQAKEEALANVQEALAKKVQTCKDAYANAKSAMSTYQNQVEANRAALEKIKTALSAMDSATKTSGQQWLNYKTQIEQAEKQLKVLENTSGDTSDQEAKLRQEIEQARSAMDKLEAETGGAAKTAGELLQQQQSLTTEMDRAEAGYNAAEKACDTWQKKENEAQIALNNTNAELELTRKYLGEAEQATDNCATSIDEFGNQTEQAEVTTRDLYTALMSAGLLRALKEVKEAFSACVEAAAGFEAQMSVVEAISGATQDEMTALSALAKEMGATTKFTAQEAGQGLEYMAMAGWKADEMLDGLAGIMNLAAAAGADLGETSDIVTDALTAFGLTAKDSAHFSDVMAQAAANSNTNVTMMGNSFKMVATTAGSLHYSIDDVAVALGAMANQGLKSEMAGTALATAFTRMSGTNSNATKAMEALGLSMFDVNGNAKDLSVFLGELREAFAGMTEQEKVSNLYMLAGQKGMKGLQAIVNTSEADWQKLTQAIAGCSGAAEIMASTKLDNYAGQVVLLESAFDALKTEIGSVLTPVLRNLAEDATNALNWMTDVVRDHPGVVAAITGVATAFGSLLAVMAVITFVQIPALSTALKGLLLVIKNHPVGLLVTALSALAVGIVTAISVAKAHAEAQKVETNAAKALSDVLEEQRQAYEDVKEETQTAADSARTLANTVISLAESARTSAADHDALLSMIDQLNEAVPGLNLAFNEETGLLSQSTDAILAQVEAQNQLSEAQAAQERYNELLLNQTSIEQDIAENQEKYNAAQERYNELLDGSPLAYFTGEAQDCLKTMSDTSEAIGILNGELEKNGVELANVQAQVDSFAASQTVAKDTLDAAANIATKLAENLVALEDSYWEAYDASIESIQGQANLWDTLDETVAMTTEDIMGAIQSQIDYWTNYNSNLENLMGRNIEGFQAFVAEVDDGSQKSAAMIAGMAEMTDEELMAMMASYGELQAAQRATADTTADMAVQYTSTMQQLVLDAVATLNDLDQSDEVRQMALDTLQGYIGGLDEEIDDVDAELQTVAQSAIDMFKDTLDSHSPSRVFEQIGSDTMAGYINGVNGKDSSTQSALQSLAQRAIAAFRGISNSSTLNGTGSQTVQGYISGSNSQSGNAQSTLRTLAQGAINAFNGVSNGNTLRNSGSQTVSGYMSGVNSQSGQATNNMRTLANNAVNAVKNNSTRSSLYNAGSQTIQGYINGVNSRSGGLYSTLASIASSAIAKFKSVLGIRSPSRVFAEMGTFTGEGYIEGVEGQRQDIISTMESMAKQASDSFRSRLTYGLDGVHEAMYGYDTPSAGTIGAGVDPAQENNRGLAAAIVALGQKIENMEVRLETGRLVGGIASKMDSALANRRGLAERGVT